MNFWYEVKTGGSRDVYFSRLSEKYNSERKKHVFYYDFGGEDGKKEIFTIDPLTEEIEWKERVDNFLKNDDEVKCAIRDFKEETCFVHGNKERGGKWLSEKLNEWVDIGFNNEILISVNGKNIDSDNVYWIVKRIFSFTSDDENESEPVIAVRIMYSHSDKTLKRRNLFSETHLYINDKGEFNSREIFEAVWEDINKLEEEIYNIFIEYCRREDYRRYCDFD